MRGGGEGYGRKEEMVGATKKFAWLIDGDQDLWVFQHVNSSLLLTLLLGTGALPASLPAGAITKPKPFGHRQ